MALNLNKTELRISAGLPKQFPRDAMVRSPFRADRTWAKAH